VSGEAQSECTVGALVRIRSLTVLTVGDIGLGYPDQDVRDLGRDGPGEVVASCRRALVPGAALDRSMRSRPTGPPVPGPSISMLGFIW
jgi:hypothetical protein